MAVGPGGIETSVNRQLCTGQEDLHVNKTAPNGHSGSTLTSNLDGIGPASKTFCSFYATLKGICTTIIWILDTG